MLEVVVQPNGVKLFDDSGSGADMDLSVWEPSNIAGYWRLGHCTINQYSPGFPCKFFLLDLNLNNLLNPIY